MPEESWRDKQHEPLDRDARFVRQANLFLDAVEGRITSSSSLEKGVQTLRVNLAALASLEHTMWHTIREATP